jgi:DNA-binding LacI/PurR family transcriptional regulator
MPERLRGMRNTPIPVRGSLVDECVRVIRLRLEAGEWSGGLPGERTFAQILEVGRDTVRLALQRLEYEKVLSPAEAGCKRKVLIVPECPAEGRVESLRIGILSPRRLEQLPQPTLFEVDHLRRALAENGGALDLFSPSWFEQKDPTKHLAKLVEEEHCNAWILFRTSEQIQRWFVKSGIPCLVRGYPYTADLLPHLDVDWEATARHASGRLWRQGHRRVGILIPPGALRGVEAALTGAGALGEADFSLLEMPEDGTVNGVCRALARALTLKSPPTALIVLRPRQVATALTWLGTQGIRVPTDFGIISLAHDPFMDNLVPELSGYRVDPETVSKLVIRRVKMLISGNPGRGRNSWITPEVVKGASIGTRT